MSSDSLQPKPIPKPPAGAGQLRPDQLPGDGRPPLKSGTVTVSDYTRRQLETIGWKEGDPIPGDLGLKIQEIQKEVETSRADRLEDSELAKGWQPPKPNFVDITQLPPEKQQELAAYLQEHKREVAERASEAATVQAADAQIPQNIQGEQRDLMRDQIVQSMAAKAASEQPGSILVDDSGAKPVQPSQSTAAPSPPQQAPAVTPVENNPPGPVHCPRCLWPVKTPFDTQYTEEDKKGFLAATLGLKRFEKKYSLMAGNLEIFFRSLTTKETETIQVQTAAFTRDGVINGEGAYWLHVMAYRLALSVSKIVIGGNVIYTCDSFLDWCKSNPAVDGSKIEATDLPRFLEMFQEKGPQHEPIRRILSTEHQKFQRLVEFLEVMSLEPDFYKGIVLRG